MIIKQRLKSAVVRYSVNFDAIKLNGISTDGYTLYKAAKTVYRGDSDIALSELCDWALIDDTTTLRFPNKQNTFSESY